MGKFKRHEKSCKKASSDDVNSTLSNVRYEKASICIRTKNGKTVRLYGDKLEHDNTSVRYAEINSIEWIIPDASPFLKAKNKSKHFDNIYIFYSGGRLDLEGMGQSVFPAMSFIQWARDK